MDRLPLRPRGVRKHWRRVEPVLSECGDRLRERMPVLLDGRGDPVEAVEFYRRSELKRIDAVFADGAQVSLSRHAAGHFTYRMRMLPVGAPTSASADEPVAPRPGGSTIADSDGDDGA